jgi:hypothetical protein
VAQLLVEAVFAYGAGLEVYVVAADEAEAQQLHVRCESVHSRDPPWPVLGLYTRGGREAGQEVAPAVAAAKPEGEVYEDMKPLLGDAGGAGAELAPQHGLDREEVIGHIAEQLLWLRERWGAAEETVKEPGALAVGAAAAEAPSLLDSLGVGDAEQPVGVGGEMVAMAVKRLEHIVARGQRMKKTWGAVRKSALGPAEDELDEEGRELLDAKHGLENRMANLEMKLQSEKWAPVDRRDLAQAAGRNDHKTLYLMLVGDGYRAATQNDVVCRIYEWRSSPLMLAAAGGATESLVLRLEAGAGPSVRYRDKDGFTAAMHAAQNGHDDCLRLLLEHMAATAKEEAANAGVGQAEELIDERARKAAAAAERRLKKELAALKKELSKMGSLAILKRRAHDMGVEAAKLNALDQAVDQKGACMELVRRRAWARATRAHFDARRPEPF